jgi:predicted DNA-binding transcriptional regulator AlpA
METTESTRLIDEKEAARYLRLSVQTLRNWRAQHRPPNYVRLGRAIRYDIAELEDFIRESRVTINA